MGVTDQAQGVPPPLHPAGELGVVGQHRAHPHQNGPVAAALGVDVAAGGLPGDPLGGPGVGRQLAIQGHGVLEHHIGPAGLDVVKEHVVQGPAFLRQHPHGHLDPLGPKLGQALAGHQGVGVPGAHHHPGDAGLQNGLGAGGLLSLVAAGLQGDVEGGAGGVLPAGGQRRPLGVEVSPPGVVPLADDPPLLHQHSPHHGVGAGPAGPLLGQVQSQGHIVLICHLDHLRARKNALKPIFRAHKTSTAISSLCPSKNSGMRHHPRAIHDEQTRRPRVCHPSSSIQTILSVLESHQILPLRGSRTIPPIGNFTLP